MELCPLQTGWSALMAAVYKHHDDIVEQLLKGGATPLIQDKVVPFLNFKRT